MGDWQLYLLLIGLRNVGGWRQYTKRIRINERERKKDLRKSAGPLDITLPKLPPLPTYMRIPDTWFGMVKLVWVGI